MMLAEALKIDFNKKYVDIMNGGCDTPEFKKVILSFTVLDWHYSIKLIIFQINVCHTVPTIVDDGFTLWESRAILGFLADKYDNTGMLYPSDPQQRAIVNQRLMFDFTLYERYGAYYFPRMTEKIPEDFEKFKKFEDFVAFLDEFLSKTKYAAGDKITIADYSLIASWSTVDVSEYDWTRFENIARWFDLCKKTLPGIEVNAEGVALMAPFVEAFKKNQQA